jgi:hypothetical protein
VSRLWATAGWYTSVLAIWLVAGTALAWGWLPGRWRRLVAILTSAAGLGFLLVAVNSEGLREAPTVGVFLMGTPYVTGQTSALASLPYYVLTGICLLLGTAGLAVGDDLARVIERRWMVTAIALSVVVTATRFAMEKTAAPPAIAQVFGLIWLAPVVGAFFYAALRAEGKGWRALVPALFFYGIAVRSFVTVLYFAATAFHLGSHYDLGTAAEVRAPWGRTLHFVPGTLAQFGDLVLFPQLLVWPLFTVVSGALGALMFRLLMAAWPSVPRSPIRGDASLAATDS